MKKIFTTIAISALTAFFCIGGTCDKPTQVSKIELISPRSGSFVVGTPVTISFRVNDPEINQVLASVSINNGRTWSLISTEGTPSSSGTLSWTIGGEGQQVNYTNDTTTAKIRVTNYDQNIADISGIITITKQ